MAIVFLGRSRCPLCDEIIQEGDKYVGTSHFMGDQSDPLWRFSDVAMHRRCFLSWEERIPFIERYNQTLSHRTFGNGTYHQMTNEGDIVSIPREGGSN